MKGHLQQTLFLLLAPLLLHTACSPNNQQGDTSPAQDTPTAQAHQTSGPVDISVSAEPARIHIGEMFQYSFSVTAPNTITILPPDIPDPEQIDPFLIRDLTTPQVNQTANGTTITGAWTLDTFKIGALEIPPLSVRYIASNTETQVAHSAALSIQVESTLEQTGALPDIADVKSPENPTAIPIDRRLWFAIAASLLLLAVMILAAVRWLRQRTPTMPTRPTTPPHQIALQALHQLAHTLPDCLEAIDPFYVRLTEIVRVYVEQRFGIQAPERTTEEFLAELEQSQDLLLAPQKRSLRQFLAQSDLVKFARFHPAPEDTRNAVDQAIAFVEATQPTPQDPSQAQEVKAP